MATKFIYENFNEQLLELDNKLISIEKKFIAAWEERIDSLYQENSITKKEHFELLKWLEVNKRKAYVQIHNGHVDFSYNIGFYTPMGCAPKYAGSNLNLYKVKAAMVRDTAGSYMGMFDRWAGATKYYCTVIYLDSLERVKVEMSDYLFGTTQKFEEKG